VIPKFAFAILAIACLVASSAAWAESKENNSTQGSTTAPLATKPASDPSKLCAKKHEPGAGASTVSIIGVVTKGAKPINKPIAWTVRRIGGECRGETLVTATGPKLQTRLDPGKYRVTGVYDNTEASELIEVGKGQKISQQLNFKSASASFRLIPHVGAPVIQKPIHWQVYEYVRSERGTGKLVGQGNAATQHFTLREGTYIVRASYNGTVTDLVVPVKAGEKFLYTVNLYSGHVRLKAVNGSKKDVKGEVTYEIARAKPDKNGKREVLATKVSPSEPLMLREGKYLVTARAGKSTGSTMIDVAAGKTKNVVVTLKP
jgi:hypothetical protein